jgi:hypothetical protein
VVISFQNYAWFVMAVLSLGALHYNSSSLKTSLTSTPTTFTGTAVHSKPPPPQGPVHCKYHGNCPVGTACRDGLCLPYLGNATTTTTITKEPGHTACVEACLAELTVDEGSLFGSIPVVQSTHAAWHGHGCVVRYRRQRRTEPWLDRPTMEERIQGRLRRVIRVDFDFDVDVAAAGGGNRDNWKAVCDLPCETDAECPNGLSCAGRTESSTPPGISSAPKGCRSLPHPTAAAKPILQDMVIVSGANSAYFEGLKNLAASLRFWAPHRQLVVYNLGMTRDELVEVKSWPNVEQLHWPDGIPNSYPKHVQHDLKNYAWKSIVINETVHEYKSIFWLDAGATFTSPVDPIEEILQRHGLFLVKGQDDHMKHLSHPATYQWFGHDKQTYATGPHWAGGIQGHVYPSRYIDTIVIPNAKCALDPTCIAPPGATLQNHRYDQTTLSLLGYQPHVRAPAYTEFLAADRSQLPSNLSEPNRFIIWTARGSCDYYAELI